MSETSGETKEKTRIEELRTYGKTYGKVPVSSAFFVRPPLTDEEFVIMRDAPDKATGEDLSPAQQVALEDLRASDVMRKILMIGGNATIDGKEGSVLIFNRQELESRKITELVSHLAGAISALRGEDSFELALNPAER